MSLPDCDGWGSYRQNLRDYSARTHRVVLDMIMIMTFYHYTQSNKLFVCVPEEGLDNTQ